MCLSHPACAIHGVMCSSCRPGLVVHSWSITNPLWFSAGITCRLPLLISQLMSAFLCTTMVSLPTMNGCLTSKCNTEGHRAKIVAMVCRLVLH